MFSLKTNNLEAYLLSLSGYGTHVNVLTLHNLENVQKLSICRTVATYKNKHEQIYGKPSIKVIDLGANRKRIICNFLLVINSNFVCVSLITFSRSIFLYTARKHIHLMGYNSLTDNMGLSSFV